MSLVVGALLLETCGSTERLIFGEGEDSGGAAGDAGGGGGAAGGRDGAGGASGADAGGDGGSGARGDGASGGESAAGGSGGVGAWGGAAGEGGDDDGALRFTTPPELRMSTDPNTPLFGELTLETNRDTSVSVTTTVDSQSFNHVFAGLRRAHSHTLFRFRPDRTHRLAVSAEDEQGNLVSHDLEARTPPLPATFPVLSAEIQDPDGKEPGVLLMGVPGLTAGGHIVMLDESGQVVWWHHEPKVVPHDLRRLPSGNLLVGSHGRRQVLEVDMRGVVQRNFVARGPLTSTPPPVGERKAANPKGIEVATDSFHHDCQILDSGNLLALSSEVRSVESFPTSELDATPRAEPLNVVGDAVIEVSPSGEVLETWSVFDLIDPYRIGWNSFGNTWRVHYGDPTNIDWTHSNAVILDPRDGHFILSVRNQDAVVKFSRSREIRWILADPANWDERFVPFLLKPKGDDFAWPYHQHSLEITSRGTLLLYDNGARRASPPDEGLPAAERYSRALELEIDEKNLEVSVRWAYGSRQSGPDRFYTAIMGDVDELPRTRNILVTMGAIFEPAEGEPSAIVREVTHTTPARVVSEVRVEDDDPNGPGSRRVYRAEHLPGLYVE